MDNNVPAWLTIAVAAISSLSALAGSFLVAHFSVKQARFEIYFNAKSKAYSDFILKASESPVNYLNTDTLTELTALLNVALMYAPVDVQSRLLHVADVILQIQNIKDQAAAEVYAQSFSNAIWDALHTFRSDLSSCDRPLKKSIFKIRKHNAH